MLNRNRRRSFPIIAGIALAVVICLAGIDCQADEDGHGGSRPDLLTIDTMAADKSLERPPVQFPHDEHTEKLAGEQGGCTICHPAQDGRNSLKFMRLEDDPATLMDLYHDGCIGCHGKRKAEGKETGPVGCGDCHRNEPEYASSRVPAGFDKSMHARHIKAVGGNCADCHHEGYSPETDSFTYSKGKESSCRDCHGLTDTEKSSSMRKASHRACISCHMKTAQAKKASGPVDCKGCHDAELRKQHKVLADPPRLDRNQPDVTWMNTAHPDKNKGKLPLVRFNHRLHEQATDSCRQCHHESMRTCSECHTLTGVMKGQNVTLEEAMHRKDSDHSCVGCHEEVKRQPHCAACHFMQPKGQMPERVCWRCHTGQPESVQTTGEEKATEKGFSFADEDIPKTVTIDVLQNKFGPATFPHRKIIDTMAGWSRDSELATHFHGTEDALCQGCHHNSPVGEKPPACGSCHDEPFDAKAMNRPGLMGAYHNQCIGCHKEIGMSDPTNCTTCHKPKEL